MPNRRQSSEDSNEDDDDDDRAFEQFLQEHRTPIVIKCQQESPLQRRRKKRNSLKDFIRDSSSSSSSSEAEDKEHPSEFYPKVDRLLDADASWQKLKDVYTSEESDEKKHIDQLSLNDRTTHQLKSEVYTSDRSTRSSSTSSDSDAPKKKPTRTPVNFLESLSEHVPIQDKHPDTVQYFTRSGFKNKQKRQDLAERLLSTFDRDVFSSKLSDKVTVVWSGRLTATAGHCTTRRKLGTAVITLSHKVCDSPDRCRDTLLHEMCHAAVTLIDGSVEHGHGPLWRQWTRSAERCYPYLPLISVKHTYDIVYKFIYRCIQCRHEVYRHSKSLDLALDFCGKCMGRFELLVNKDKSKTNIQQTPKKTPNRYNLFVKEHFQTFKQEQPHLSTPQLMQHLGKEYKKRMEQQDPIDLPDFDQLKI